MANRLVSYFRSKSKAKQKARNTTVSEFSSPDGLAYETFFERIHATYLSDWYMEIGCRYGTIFSLAQGKTIAVDPYFQVTRNAVGPKPALHIFQATSDDFFADGFLEKNDIKLSVTFLDGMHLFEYLLRDFINTERNSQPNGVIGIHDCCPRDIAMTTRDLENLPERSWTGDVWKMLPILQKYRPGLTITVLDCYSTGLVLVSNLDPSNDALEKNYDAILEAYMAIDLENFGVRQFFASFSYTDGQAYLDAGAVDFARIALDPELALQPKFITP